MSLRAMLWALKEAPCTSATQRVILLAMADPAHDDGTCSFLSQATIAGIVGVSDRTVREHIGEMERLGLIKRGDQELVSHYRGDRRPVVWDLRITRPEISSGRKSDVATAGSLTGHGRKPASDKPSTNQELNRGKAPSKDSRLLASLRTEQQNPAQRCSHGQPMFRHPACFGIMAEPG
jgi:hypothetical protein